MEFRHLGFLSTHFCLALLGCHVQASLPAEDYWRSLWRNTPMPKALRDLVQSDYVKGGRTGWRASGRSQPRMRTNKIDVDAYGEANKDGDPTTLKLYALNVPFFFEHDLNHLGKKLNLEFTKRSDEFTFLPDTAAKSIPFSSSRFPEILTHFDIEAESTNAEMLKHTLDMYDLPVIKGEDKYCATSMESLVNFTVSKLGKNIRLLSTAVEKETTEKLQQYSVVKGVRKAGDKAVACHKLNYLYAMFYCHKVATRAYTVPLVGTDGTKAKALAVYHTDTRKWSRGNLAFQQLNVKPGTVPVCHFLATDTLLWVPN